MAMIFFQDKGNGLTVATIIAMTRLDYSRHSSQTKNNLHIKHDHNITQSTVSFPQKASEFLRISSNFSKHYQFSP